ncbi:hypothetical protein N7468_003298 [Penicillium chermesinum]|uniref:Nuclear pore complex subunit Nup133 n=1 Tax=Penicillium chermesinum TaxID=63820 RepID=A0A9W9P6B1_9EURO|nr:uncharacterized protein N7468_003298 [Penicillium chermesinum]KAJ5238679.1 hypothetical protein N7468_003298 [Penicillium chermesinum]
MFIPKGAVRNPRRRQRTSSDDSVKPPKAKRQRSVLRQTGDPPPETDNKDTDLIEPIASVSLEDLDPVDPTVDSHLHGRSTKLNDNAKNDIEGTLLLSSTDHYTVEQLPALPDQIRVSQSGPLKCFFTTSHDYALALTHSHAIVWPYSVPTSAPSPSQTFTVSIPEASRDLDGHVPLGVLLSTATGEYPGLLVIIPSTGKLIYWETVSSAASLSLSRQKQNGIQGSTPGLLSGEYVSELLNCEPSGIIATFSSGRVAHIALRNAQGKPHLSASFLRTTSSGGGSGFGILGGLKSVLGGGYWRKEVTAVRAGASRQRGQRDVIIITSKGLVEIWDTHWNHGNTLKRKIALRDELLAALPAAQSADPPEIKIMDFAFADSSDADDTWRIFLLAGPVHSNELSVLELHLSDDKAYVLSSQALDVQQTIPNLSDPACQARLLVSKSETTAFVIVGQCLVLLSLSSAMKETPTSQLLLDSNQMPLFFQDTIHLRSGKEHEILGYGLEDLELGNEDCASCVVMIRNFGILRVKIVPRYQTAEDDDLKGSPCLTVKHKLEQAIFFGTMARNPLNLSGSGIDYAAPEIEEACLEICREILHSDSRFIPNTTISIEQNLRLRARALNDLALLLRQNGNNLSRPARWELLWSAEKIAAQRSISKMAEEGATGEEKFLAHGIYIRFANGFSRDSYRMEHIIPWIKNAIKPRRGNSSKQARKLSEQILAASELFLAIMETGFRYREEHAALFGLGDDFIEDGVLADGYEDLPEFWTSTAVGYAEAGHLLDWELDSCRAWIQQKTSDANAPEGSVLKSISDNSARHLRILGQMHRERTRWLAAQEDPKLADEAISIEQAHIKERKWQLFKLAGINHLEDALGLAEQFRDMGALVELVIELQDQVKGQHSLDSGSGTSDTSPTEADVDHRISQYFERFGEPWADAYFSRQISMGHPGALLSMRRYQAAITRFLRKAPLQYSKISWINDVNGEDDYESAAACLSNLALNGEKQLWCHRVQISLAKLNKLAACEKLQSKDHTLASIDRFDGYNCMDEIQQNLYLYVQPVLEGAIDQKAEAELALEYLGGHLVHDRPSLHEVLGEALSKLVHRNVVRADGLIDLLTLMDHEVPSSDGEGELFFQRFYLALQVLDQSDYVQQDASYVSALQKLIWRRCMTKDDWEARGKAAEGSNGSIDTVDNTSLYHTLWFCSSQGSAQKAIYRPFAPEDALMGESDVDILVSRLRPEKRARIATDLKREDSDLRKYIQTGKLDFWFQHILATIQPQVSSLTEVTT